MLVLSAIFWRSTWKYRARAYRYCFWDAGTILANLLAAAAAEGLSTELVTAFADPEIEALLGIDGEHEGALCLVALGSGAAAPAAEPELRPLSLETIPLSREEVELSGPGADASGVAACSVPTRWPPSPTRESIRYRCRRRRRRMR